MKTGYFLKFNGKSAFLFELDYSHKYEEPSVFEFELKLKHTECTQAESVIRQAYKEIKGVHLPLSPPAELLKLLLAYGCTIYRDDYELAKSYLPVRYIAKSNSHKMDLGDFYYFNIAEDTFGFPAFCMWLDSIKGEKGYSLSLIDQCISSQMSIYAKEKHKGHLLLDVTGPSEKTIGPLKLFIQTLFKNE